MYCYLTGRTKGVRPESGGGAGRRRSEGPSGPGKEDAARSDSGFAPKNN
ncbi:hypothetical protein [Clostridium sp. chh4-2]|nr:hypothetical protein [Clostridium sp. chh4-2]